MRDLSLAVWDDIRREVRPVDGIDCTVGDPDPWLVEEVIDFPHCRIVVERSSRGHIAVWYTER